MTIEEWAKDFKSYVNALDMPRDDYNGIIEYIDDAIDLLKEQEAMTQYVIDDFQPTCKACGFRPFAGFIPSLEWMRERGFNFCPHCKRKVKWNDI